MNFRLGILFFTSAILVGSTPIAFADTGPCTIPNTRPATASDPAVQNGVVPVGTCIDPNAAGVNSSANAAKQYLLSIAEGLPGSAAPPTRERINMLNDTFAVCAANFIKKYTDTTGVPIKLRSAVRCGPNSPAAWTCDRGENARAGGATGSNHQTGLAMDINPTDGNYQRLWKAASDDPSQGVCFPYLGSDRPHLAMAGTGTGEAASCARQGVTRQCSGAPTLDTTARPGQIPPNGPTPTGGSAPTGGTNNPFANPYNPTQQGQMCMISTNPIVMVPCGQQTQQTPMPQTPMPQTPTQTGGTNPTTQSPTTGSYTGSYTDSYVSPTNATTSTSTVYTPPPPYTYRATSSTDGQSTLESIQGIAGGGDTGTSGQSTPTSSSSPTQLNDNLYDVVNEGSTGGSSARGDLAIVDTIPATSVPDTGVRATETFTQQQQPGVQAASDNTNQPMIIAILTSIRDFLLSYLNFLKSNNTYGFQGAWQPQTAPLVD